METSFLHIEEAYKDWLTRQVDDTDLPKQRWAYAVINDCIQNLLRGDNFIKGIALIPIKNKVGVLPPGFRHVTLAAFAQIQVPPTRTIIRDYIQYNLGDDCKFVVSLECNKCGKTECECSDLLYRIDLQEFDYPELRLKNYPHFHNFKSPDPLHPYGNCKLAPGFHIMRPAQGAFHNSQYYTKECLNLNVDTEIAYEIDLPNIVLNFDEGWVLLSYKGYAMQDGFLKVPNNPKVFAAIRANLDFWWDYARSRNKLDNETQARLKLSKQLLDETEYAAIGELSKISPDRWDSIAAQLNQLIPTNGYENMYRRGYDFGDFENYLE